MVAGDGDPGLPPERRPLNPSANKSSVSNESVARALSRRSVGSNAPYRAYPRRWVVLLAFALLMMCNASTWITYSSISANTTRKYDVSQTWVDTLSILFMALYIPVNFPASWALERFGVRRGTLCGGAMTVVGSALRCAAQGPGTFAFLVAGQALCAAGQPLLLNAPPKLSAVWFPERQRAVATALASVSQLFGVIAAFVLPPAIVGDDDDRVPVVSAAFAAACAAAFVFACVAMRDRPPTPPSPAADVSVEQHDFRQDLRELMFNTGFRTLAAAFGLALGVFNTTATILAQIVAPFGYSSGDAGLLGGLNIGVGLVGAAIAAVLLDATRRYKEVLCVCFFAGAGATALMWTQLHDGRLPVLAVATAAQGFLLQPLIPVALETGAELTYPLDESLGAGVLMLGGQIWGIVFIYSFQPLLDATDDAAPADGGPSAPSAAPPEHARVVLLSAACVIAAAGCIALLVRKEYRRVAFEQQAGEDDAAPPPGSDGGVVP